MSDESVKTNKRTSTQRLRIASGHLLKVIEMSEKGEPNMAVLQQVSAVVSALRSCSILLVLDHVNQEILNGKPLNQQEFLRDLENVLERSIR